MMPLLMPHSMSEELIREVIEKSGGKGFAMKGISNEDYHAGPGLSSTDIKSLVNGTVAAWEHRKANPEAPTPALRLGNAIHTYILEKDVFWDRYCLMKDSPEAPSRSTKIGKAEWEAFCKSGGGELELTSDEWKAVWIKWRHPDFKKDIISLEDLQIIEGIATSVQNHPLVSQIIAQGESEVTLYWIDQATDILCKARTDRLNKEWPCIPDLKSTEDASLDAFEHSITQYDYHVSAFWYLWGAREVFQFDFLNFVYIPCEKKPPYLVTLYTADEGSLSVGEGIARAGLLIYKRYLDQKKKGETWTGHSLDPKAAGIRPYAFNKLSQVIHSHDLQGLGLEKYIGVV